MPTNGVAIDDLRGSRAVVKVADPCCGENPAVDSKAAACVMLLRRPSMPVRGENIHVSSDTGGGEGTLPAIELRRSRARNDGWVLRS